MEEHTHDDDDDDIPLHSWGKRIPVACSVTGVPV
jgi:hypothetical protein